jgi:hypothetical protein
MFSDRASVFSEPKETASIFALPCKPTESLPRQHLASTRARLYAQQPGVDFGKSGHEGERVSGR